MSSKSKLIISVILLVVGVSAIPTGFYVNQYLVQQVYDAVPDALLGIQEEALPSIEEQLPGLATPDVFLGIKDEALISLLEQFPALATPDVLQGIEDQALISLLEQFPALATPDVLQGIEDQALISLLEQFPALATPDVLLGIEDQALISLLAQFPALATPEVLLGIEDQALNILESQLPFLTTPDVLLGLKQEMEEKMPVLINCATAANVISLVLSLLGDFDTASNILFNDPTFEFPAGIFTLKGVSNFTGVNMGYTLASRQALLVDGISIPGVGDIPGLINDTTLGTGVCGFLEVYNASIYDFVLNQTIQLLYSATWPQLSAVAGWLQFHVFPDVVPGAFQFQYGFPVSDAVLYGFYFQWANGTLIEDGIDLSVFLETYDTELKGFEAGIPTPTNISLTTCINMWDPTIPLSFVNESGIFAWLDISYQAIIESFFSINTVQYFLILGWLVNFITNLTPIFLYEETGYTVPELAQLAFYEQWANGTIQGEAVLPGGFLAEIDPSFAGTPYFEVGLTTGPTGLTVLQCEALWDESNGYSLVNSSGIVIWLAALTNSTIQSILEGIFGLSIGQSTMLLIWLGAFYTVRIPQLLEYETGYTVPELAQLAFYEQWANGTIQGEVVLPDGFLAELDPSFAGTPYFEVGLTTGPTGLTILQCEALWDESNGYSLVNSSGIVIWLAALTNSTIQSMLELQFSLSVTQSTSLLTWLGAFYTIRIPQLLEYETGHTVPELAQLAFYEQWANGTIQGKVVLPDGFLAELDPAFAGAPYFEVGIPVPSNLSLIMTMNLWNESDPYTFVNMNGIQIWLGAITDATLQTLLVTTFGLTPTELTLLLNWLGAFYTVRIPQLLEYETGHTVPELAQLAFYEQWANGTIQGKVVLPDGFLAELDPAFAGAPYFEVGIPVPSNLSLIMTMNLWNESNPYTFVNMYGIQIWLGAITNATLQTLLITTFGLTPTELTLLLNWLGAFYTVRIPQLLEYETGHTVPELAQLAFYEQWANGTIQGKVVLPDGFLAELNPAFAGTPYFEVGLTTGATNLTLLQCGALWNESNSYSLVNSDGIVIWLAAIDNSTLQSMLEGLFGLSVEQSTMLLTWLGAFYTVRIPQLLEYETGFPVPELIQLSFYEQWANGTIQGEAVLPDGFLAELDPSFAGTPYFEVGLTTGATNLTLLQCGALWDESNVYSLVNSDGILIWLDAIDNSTLQTLLEGEFNLSVEQSTMLLTWLGDFLTVRVPQLLFVETGHTIPELAQFVFYEQWANGTMNGSDVLPDGFLSMLDPPIYGPPFFEVGLTQGSTGLTVSQCEALWDETSEYSLVSASGINNWYNAEPNNTIYESLKLNNNGISDTQMNALLEWLPQFRDVIVNQLAKIEEDLPMEPDDLGRAILTGVASGGAVLAVLGIIVLILSRRE